MKKDTERYEVCYDEKNGVPTFYEAHRITEPGSREETLLYVGVFHDTDSPPLT